jgi:hypothetical protein
MKHFLISIAVLFFFFSIVFGDDPAKKLSDLTNQELVNEYEHAGLILQNTWDMPATKPTFLANPIHGPDYPRFLAARRELVRRRKAAVPDLVKFLAAEKKQDRPTDAKGRKCSFAIDTMEILEHIGDPRPVEVILTFLEDKPELTFLKTEPEPEREFIIRAAHHAMMTLTYISFHRFEEFHGFERLCVQHPGAETNDYVKDANRVAKLYREWLAKEGNNPEEWLDIARGHARKQMAAGDLGTIFAAAAFLSDRNARRDDKPWETLKRLAEVAPGSCDYVMRQYGPRAQPYAKTLIQIQRKRKDNNWSGYETLWWVGGKEIVAFVVEKMPIIEAEVRRLKADPKTPKGFSSDDERGWWFDSLYAVERLFDRWVGRTFSTNAGRLEWWKSNKDKPLETWLRDNLDVVAKQADEGNVKAREVMTFVLPDMPYHRGKTQNLESLEPSEFICAADDPNLPTYEKAKGPNPYTTWLNDHHDKLRYVAEEGGFRISVLEKEKK